MDDIEFIIPTAPRTKKNHGQLVTLKTGRQLMLPSKQYLKLEKETIKFIKKNFPDIQPIDKLINMQCKFYKDRDYKADLTGYLQAIQDALVKAGVLKDDNHKIIKSVNGSEVFLDRNNPRIEVKITFYKEKNEKDSPKDI